MDVFTIDKTYVKETLSTWMNLNHMAAFSRAAKVPKIRGLYGYGRNGPSGYTLSMWLYVFSANLPHA